MTTFILEFIDEEGVPYTEELDFEAIGDTSAREWAEGYCYRKADKGYYRIKEIKCPKEK